MPDIQNLSENQPLPESDIVLSSEESQFLASYLKLDDALAKACPGQSWPSGNLLPGDPAAQRYTILASAASDKHDGSAKAPPFPGLAASLQATKLEGAGRAVIAAVPRSAPAKDQIQPVLASSKDPASLAAPADLPANVAVIAVSSGSLKFNGSARLGFNFNWLREIAMGRVGGDIGLKIDTAQDASLNFSISGDFAALVTHDCPDWLHLRICKRSNSGTDFATALSVGAQAATPFPEKADDLLAAIMGVNQVQLLKSIGDKQLVPDRVAPILDGAFESFAAFSSLSPALQRRLADSVGAVKCEADFLQAKAGFAKLIEFRNAIYQKALDALAGKYSASLSYTYQSVAAGAALFDCSFDFTPEGIAAYRRALAGDFLLVAGPHVQIHHGLFTHEIRQESTIELHLPFMTGRNRYFSLDAIAKAEIKGDDEGRLLVYTVEASGQVAEKNRYQSMLALSGTCQIVDLHSMPDFTLAYTNQTRFRPFQLQTALEPILNAYGFDPSAGQSLAAIAAQAQGDVTASLTLAIPGKLAAAWLQAPLERDPTYSDTFLRISIEVQTAFRKWLPLIYFNDLARYDNIASAFPLLMYQCSRPFRTQSKTQFTYDVMNPESRAAARKVPLTALRPELARVSGLLKAAGKSSIASFYRPSQAPDIVAAVSRNSRLFDGLLYSDAIFVDQLIRLGTHARRFQDEAPTKPECGAKDLSRFAADLAATFNVRLRRLYGGQSFESFGSLLLVQATAALTSQPAAIQATLSITAGNLKQTLVNKSGSAQ